MQLHPDQEITDEGQRLVCTLFVLFGEAQRFAKARKWVIDAVASDIALTLSPPLAKLFRDWKGMSKTGMRLYVALYSSNTKKDMGVKLTTLILMKMLSRRQRKHV